MAEKLTMKTANLTQEHIAKIRELFPNCVTETSAMGGGTLLKIDFDALKQELSDSIIQTGQERYQMTWPDKNKARILAGSPISATLRPCQEESVNFDTTKNLYIEGDNLDVLKLLRETYLGKVKMIYIDPPYNTGNDFVYGDDYSQSVEDYLAKSGQYDEQGNRLFQNTESNGRFHSDWLNMIYPRLKVARDLLSDDGAIFISIDDHEVENLIKVCNEIFGEKNKIGLMSILSNPRGSQNSKHLSYVHEYILMYAKNESEIEVGGLSKSEENLSEFCLSDSKGKYRLLGLRKRGGAWRKEDRPNMFYPIYVNPEDGSVSLEQTEKYSICVIPKRPTGELSRWCWGIPKFKAECSKLVGKPVNRSGEPDAWDIFRKDYLNDESGAEKTSKVKTIWVEKETNYQNAKNEIKALFGNSEVFDFPKPTYMMKTLCTLMAIDEGDIVLDFFSGSASTAHAVLAYNAECDTKAEYILVQLPESLSEKSQAYQLGYRTICEIGKERIRRAGKKIKEETGADIDYGFRVLKLDSSNMQDVYYNPSAISQSILEQTIDNVKPDRTPLDLLFQVMLELGVELSAQIVEKEIKGKKYYTVNSNDIIACFDDDIDNEVITEIAKQKPIYAVFKDRSFATDSVGINNEQLFKTYSPSTEIKVV